MKITYRWLGEFVPLTVSPAGLAQQLTLAGLEVESVGAVAPPFDGVVVGEVLETARHPDADKLAVCTVTTDGADRLQIICGAPNVRAGLKVAVARIGARLPGDVTIRRARLRGPRIRTACCVRRANSAWASSTTASWSCRPALANNTDLRAALDLDDSVLEINATPNRGDCMSVFGIARDYAAAQQRRHLTLGRAGGRGGSRRDVFRCASRRRAACALFATRVCAVYAAVRAPPIGCANGCAAWA